MSAMNFIFKLPNAAKYYLTRLKLIYRTYPNDFRMMRVYSKIIMYICN